MKADLPVEEEVPYIDTDGECAWPKCRRETAVFIRIEKEGEATKRIPLCDLHVDMFLSEDPKEELDAYKALKLKKDRTLFIPPTEMPIPDPPAKEESSPTPPAEKKEIPQKPKLEVDSKLSSLLDRLRAGEFELEDG